VSRTDNTELVVIAAAFVRHALDSGSGARAIVRVEEREFILDILQGGDAQDVADTFGRVHPARRKVSHSRLQSGRRHGEPEPFLALAQLLVDPL
jgi:hypothetical protein